MRDGGSIERASPPVAQATNGTTERESGHAPDQKYSRELRGLTNPKHFENHPRHDSVFAHSSATASRSTSAAPSIKRKKVGPTISDVGTNLGMVLEASSSDERPVSGRNLRLRDPTGDRATAPRTRRATAGKGKRSNDPNEQFAAAMSEVGGTSEDKERGILVAQSTRCTRSQLGRTAPPETTDVEDICTGCKIRARTNGALDCVRYVFSSLFRTQLTTFRCRRHARIYEFPWPKRYDPSSAAYSHRNQLKRKREDEPGMSRAKKRHAMTVLLVPRPS